MTFAQEPWSPIESLTIKELARYYGCNWWVIESALRSMPLSVCYKSGDETANEEHTSFARVRSARQIRTHFENLISIQTQNDISAKKRKYCAHSDAFDSSLSETIPFNDTSSIYAMHQSNERGFIDSALLDIIQKLDGDCPMKSQQSLVMGPNEFLMDIEKSIGSESLGLVDGNESKRSVATIQHSLEAAVSATRLAFEFTKQSSDDFLFKKRSRRSNVNDHHDTSVGLLGTSPFGMLTVDSIPCSVLNAHDSHACSLKAASANGVLEPLRILLKNSPVAISGAQATSMSMLSPVCGEGVSHAGSYLTSFPRHIASAANGDAQTQSPPSTRASSNHYVPQNKGEAVLEGSGIPSVHPQHISGVSNVTHKPTAAEATRSGANTIDISGISVSSGGSSHIGSLPGLKSLNLSHQNIAGINSDGVASCSWMGVSGSSTLFGQGPRVTESSLNSSTNVPVTDASWEPATSGFLGGETDNAQTRMN